MSGTKGSRLNAQIGHVYWADPMTTPFGDHDPRPVTPVEITPQPRVIKTITRTTKTPGRHVQSVQSPINTSCGLDKPGWWTERKQRPIPSRLFTTKLLRYSGRLPSQEASDVNLMWTQIKLTGRENR